MNPMTKTPAMPYQFNGFLIPAHMVKALEDYVAWGRPIGGFLTAVLENDLKEAVGRADSNNQANLPAYVGWLYNEAPSPCWGSPEKVERWLKEKAQERAANGERV